MTRGARGVHLVGASAGSGKTTRLTAEVVAALDGTAAARIAVGELAAVTYTRKAAGELVARIQASLVAAGARAEAARLPVAYIGTVHAVCLRLLEEHAIDAGLSPRVNVLADDHGRSLRQALERCVPAELRERMEMLAWRLRIFWDARVQRSDWVRPVADVMDLARANRIEPARLPDMGRRSADGVLALLPTPVASAAALDDALVAELERAARALTRPVDSTDATRKVIGDVMGALRRVGRGPLPWSEWVKLSKLAPGKPSRRSIAPLLAAAAAVERHPRLHQDLADFTRGVFEAARAGLDGYAQWKAERRLVDYTDMIDRGLAVTEDEAVAAELGDRLALLVVDELQDTSPLQLALFMRLHALAGRSVLVGDWKQCIFEYAGADPLLMEALTRWVRDSGGTSETLTRNHRSRPALVEAHSRLFAPVFARFGAPASDVVVEPAREQVVEQAALPPFGVFWLEGSKLEHDAAAIAAGVARILARRHETPVVDRASGAVRPVRAGDIAILTATNAESRAIARALEDRRIGAALARSGLVSTPEGTLLEAALGWLVDPGDSLAAAILDALGGWNGRDPDSYLAARIAARTGDQEASGPDPFEDSPWRASLEAVRARIDHLTPAEAVQLSLAALDATTLCARWPEPEQRLGNLDALLALAAAYEARCARQQEAATLSGLLRYFAEAATPIATRDGEHASDEQHVRGGDDAVTVCTYHRAKGLEWPVAILASLDRKERRSAFDVCPESDRPEFDPDDPLGGRWIRYWPWPFGGQKTAPLAAAAAGSPEGLRVEAREERERARLLYVGFTRARDHLVLAIRRSRGKLAASWLDELTGASGNPVMGLPVDAADGEVASVSIDSSHSVPARVWALAPLVPTVAFIRAPARRFFRPEPRQPDLRPGYWIAPSRAAAEWSELGEASTGEVVSLARKVELRRAGAIDWEQAGRAIHAFFAADPEGLAGDVRLERATRLLAGAGLLGHLRPDWILECSDALRLFVRSRWPAARLAHEIPLTAYLPTPHGRRRIEGTIDLLVDDGPRCAVIDHKSFPAWSESACRAKALDLAPQLLAYHRALALIDRPISSLWFHFPLAGYAIEVTSAERGSALQPGATEGAQL